MFDIPILRKLSNSRNVLIAGAGGGCDVFGGLPLYFELLKAGKKVHLANLSFASLYQVQANRLTETMVKVTPDTQKISEYFPELYLSQYLSESLSTQVPVYAFQKSGVIPLLQNYEILINLLAIDTIIVVDGGMDSLMRGDEEELGSPHEDACTLVAVNMSEEKIAKFHVCIGFGIDAFHGVSHGLVLEAVSQLTSTGDYLGLVSLHKEMHSVQQFTAACEYTFSRMPHKTSVVMSSIIAALNGDYGGAGNPSGRTRESTLWVNALMPVYWCFSLPAIANRLLYADAIRTTNSIEDVWDAVKRFRKNWPSFRPWKDIPV